MPGPFEEEEGGIGITSDVVKVKGQDPATPGYLRGDRVGTWSNCILTLHLNYVDGYTGPLLFLFERTNNYSVCVFLCFY